jgi:hypothetical protein
MPVSVTPVQIATYVRHRFPTQERGALLVKGAADGDLVVGVFGNDRYLFDKRAVREVELVREWLTAAGARELGFGVSPDGHSWAMLVQIDNRRYRTPAGRVFYAELVRAEVEEEVEQAWLAACGADPSAASRGRRPGRRAG